jgi:cytochrome c peroxidase
MRAFLALSSFGIFAVAWAIPATSGVPAFSTANGAVGRCGIAPLPSHLQVFRDGFDGAVDAAPTMSPAEASALRSLAPDTLPLAPADASNHWADDCAAARLGQRLFFDARFSGRLLDHDNDGSAATLGHYDDTGRVACSGCHLPAAGFLDTRSPGHTISLASSWGRKKAPSLLDVGQSTLVMWNGRRDTLYGQIFGVLESPAEANSGRLYVAQQLAQQYRADYESIFGPLPPFEDTDRFPPLSASSVGCAQLPVALDCTASRHGMPGDLAEYDNLSLADKDAVTRAVVNMGKAIGAYERLLSCGPGRFDDWMHGEAKALSPSEQRGAQLFVGKAGCIACHSGPFFSDQAFHNVGLIPKTVNGAFVDSDVTGAQSGIAQALVDPLNSVGAYSDGNDGRLPASASPSLLGAFKTPSLRCVGQRVSFMHTGQIATLEGVIDFFNAGGDTGFVPGIREIAPRNLTAPEKADLALFLHALDGSGPAAALISPNGF